MKMPSPERLKKFTQVLKRWNLRNDREMPWKGEKDPYKVWLSEIILQQTRVAQGMPYYERFISRYPRVEQLAAAPEAEVFRLWQGLGYYNRCKNLLAAARQVNARGAFPDTFDEILTLPGVGAYTAAAIASFAFDLPHAVVDGNVQRVLSRYFGVAAEVNSTEGKKIFQQLAEAVLDRKDPGSHNQAIMDFGATVCTPQQPACPGCPLSADCYAARRGQVGLFPVKTPKAPPRQRYFDYWVPRYGNCVYLRKRGKGDIWQNLHEFWLHEPGQQGADAALKRLLRYGVPSPGAPAGPFRQQLTHQIIHSTFREFILDKPAPVLKEKGFFPVDIAGLDALAFPRTLVRYISMRGWTG